MMNFLVILFLALDLRVLGFNYPAFVKEYSKDDRVEVYSVIDLDKCPKVIKPVCGTNGKEFLYFENKCYFEAKNYELLTQGLLEYYKCPLKFCESACPKCTAVYKPVCAVQVRTGERKTFSNPCEVKRRSCTTKKEWRIISHFECNAQHIRRALKPPTTFLHNSDCSELCPLEYQPICARFMNLEKEFSNSCELKATICQTKQKWDIIRRGPCQSSNHNIVTEFYAIDDVCPRPCPVEYKPVCAKLHNELKVFNNKCELENVVCQGHDWQIIKEGPCLQTGNSVQHNECPEVCTNQYQPVCAEYKGQQREFGNSCQLLKAICDSDIKWKVVKFGSCSINAITDACPKYCTREYKPVCAKYKNEIKEFTNKCLLEKWNCKSGKTWEILKMGACASYSPNTITRSYLCPQFCVNEYNPVCGEFNGKLRKFENMCDMQKHMCETETNWQVVKKGHCPLITEAKSSCPTICTKEYNPICVKFKGKLREFPNSCELKKSSCETNDTEWELLTTGPCPVEHHMESLKESSCANEALQPICATYNVESKTFNNICQLAEEIKRTKNNWLILHKGICSSITPAKTSSNPTTVLQETSTQATSTTEQKYTTVAVTATMLKSTQYQITETSTAAYGSTNFTTTSKPKTTAMESVTTNEKMEEVSESTYCSSKEYTGEDVVDSGSLSSTVNYNTTSSSSYIKNNSDGANYPSRAKDSNEININVKEKNSTDEDANYNSASKENSTKIQQSYAEYNVPRARTSKENSQHANGNYSKDDKSESANSKAIQEENKIELKAQEPLSKNLQNEEAANKTKPTLNSPKSGEPVAEVKDVLTSQYLEGKSLIKWIEDHIQALLSRMGNMQNIKESENDERKTYSSESGKSDSNESGKKYQESDTKNQQNVTGLNLTLINGMREAKADTAVNSKEVHDSHSHREDSDSKSNDTYETSAVNGNNKTLHQIEQVSKSSEENESTKTVNADIFPNTDNETLANERLTITENESPNKESEQSITNNNSTKSKKGEIYNGIVYKAPIYDAPTYNFIYTAPFNFHGLGPHHNNKTVVKSPFDVYHFLSSLPATSGSFGKPQAMAVPEARGNGNNIAAYKPTDTKQSKLPSPNPVKSVNEKILPPTHLTRPAVLSPPNSQYLTSLPFLNRNFAPKISNLLSRKQYNNNEHSQPKEHQPVLEAYKSAVTTLPSLPPKGPKLLPNITVQPSSHQLNASYHSPIPQQLTKSSAPFALNQSNSPQISLNSTLLKQIVETLKIITNRYKN